MWKTYYSLIGDMLCQIIKSCTLSKSHYTVRIQSHTLVFVIEGGNFFVILHISRIWMYWKQHPPNHHNELIVVKILKLIEKK